MWRRRPGRAGNLMTSGPLGVDPDHCNDELEAESMSVVMSWRLQVCVEALPLDIYASPELYREGRALGIYTDHLQG